MPDYQTGRERDPRRPGRAGKPEGGSPPRPGGGGPRRRPRIDARNVISNDDRTPRRYDDDDR